MICHHVFHVSFHTSHVLYDQIRKWGRGKKGGGRGEVDAHMVLTAVQQVQWHLLFYFYLQYSCRYMRYELAGRPLWCVTLNEYSPTWGDPSKQKKKGGGRKRTDISIKNLGKHFFSVNSEVRKIIRMTLDDFAKMTHWGVLDSTLIFQSVNQFTCFWKKICE